MPKMEENNCIQLDDGDETENVKDRRWILRDGSGEKSYGSVCSTMKDSYRHMKDQDEVGEIIGRKRELLLMKFEEEAIKEIIEECQNPITIEEYCTEYEKNFNKSDASKPDDNLLQKQEDLSKKYPLYSSIPTSYYSYRVLRQQPKESVYNFTKNVNNISPFKRTADFSKPINEVLDEMPR